MAGRGAERSAAACLVSPMVKSNRRPTSRPPLSVNSYISSRMAGPDFVSRVESSSKGDGQTGS